MIPPQINKYYITDLAPGRSLIEHAVAAGIPYFAVSWRNPTPAQRDWNLDTYVAACKEALEVACAVTGSDTANVLGICAGGVTTACLLGHLAATGESLANSVTFMVAGLDMSEESTISELASTRAVEAARARSRRAGVLEGRDLGRVFAWLRPNDLVWNYWVSNYLLGENPPAFDVLYWNADTTRLPAGLHSDFLDIFVDNALAVPGKLHVLGTARRPVRRARATPTSSAAAPTTSSRGRRPTGRPSCSAARASSCSRRAGTSRPSSARPGAPRRRTGPPRPAAAPAPATPASGRPAPSTTKARGGTTGWRGWRSGRARAAPRRPSSATRRTRRWSPRPGATST